MKQQEMQETQPAPQDVRPWWRRLPDQIKPVLAGLLLKELLMRFLRWLFRD